MDCPRCTAKLSSRDCDEAQIPHCAFCGGMFLHRGELNKIAEPTSGDLEFSTVHAESFRHKDRFGPATCPNCGDRVMEKVEFNIYTDIILDYCENCGGFWLDGAELDRINRVVRQLNESPGDSSEPAMLWFAHFIWSLPR